MASSSSSSSHNSPRFSAYSLLRLVITLPSIGYPSLHPINLFRARDDHSRRDRINIFNSSTLVLVRVEGSPTIIDSVLRDMFGDGEQPPATEDSIQAMRTVAVREGDQCVICMLEFQAGEMVKEMPCSHKFHGDCIENWLRIHGTCPVCRFSPDHDFDDYMTEDGIRDIWLTVTYG